MATRIRSASNNALSPIVVRGVLLFFVIAAFVFGGREQPLDGVHWDSAHYLQQAKVYAETPYLSNYRDQANVVAESVFELDPGEDYHAYWFFTRIGNIILLGELVDRLGSNRATISTLSLIYEAMMALFVVVAWLLSARLITTINGNDWRNTAEIGGVVAAALYLVSSVYHYLGGNLVSEPPAMLILACGSLLFINAYAKRNLALAVLSGILAFVLYVLRIDGVWNYIAFLLSLFTVTLIGRNRIWWAGYIMVAVSALSCYLAWAIIFYPLGDPRLLLKFAVAQRLEVYKGVETYKLIIVAGGFLWIGLAFGLRYLRSNPSIQLGLVWVFLTLLPRLPAILLNLPTQTRMLTLVALPLFLLTAATVAQGLRFPEALSAKKLSLLMVGLLLAVAVAHPTSFGVLREIPGLWRLQYARQFLVPPAYEQRRFPLGELEQISKVAFATPAPVTYLVSDPKEINHFLLNLIRYLGPSYAADANMVMPPTPDNHFACSNSEFPYQGDPVVFCRLGSETELYATSRTRHRVLILRRTSGEDTNHDMAAKDSSVLARTSQFVLTLPTLESEARSRSPR